MKVLIISQYFPPEQFFIPEQIALELHSRGHRVEVLTSFPNYPAGKIFPGYKQSFNFSESYKGIQIIRTPMYIDHSSNGISRALNYLSFGFSTVLKSRIAKDADVIYVYASQMTAAIAPSIWKIFGKNVPFVLHIQDLWPESVTSSGMIPGRLLPNILNSLLSKWISLVYSQSSEVISIAPTMTEILKNRGVRPSKIETIFNWADTENIHIPNKRVRSDQIEVVYAGNIGHLQNLSCAILAAEKMQHMPEFCLTLVGDGSALQELKELVKSRNIENVRFIPRVPSSKISEIYNRSTFQLISLKDLQIFQGTIPSKFQTAISLGIPVITSVPGDVKRIVDETKIGFSAEANDIDSLYKCFLAATKVSSDDYRNMETNCQNLYKSKMSREISIPKIEEVLEKAIANSR